MKIAWGSGVLNSNKKTLIIAEAGVNHNGDLEIAKRLITVAAKAGADFVKFQTFKSNAAASHNAPKADYQSRTTPKTQSQTDMLSMLEISYDWHYELVDHAKAQGVRFLSSSFDLESAEFLKTLNLGVFKIPSGEITNLPYLRLVGSFCQPIILSTGMSDLGTIGDALDVLVQSGAKRSDITLLHCTTEYPAPFVDINLRAMETMRNTFGLDVGYSDHTVGITASIAAAALGATIIEKHFTLDRFCLGPDQKASIEPDELIALVKAVREVELSLGDGQKLVSENEAKNIPIVRKSLVAKTPIKKGDKFSPLNIDVKRPGNGINPMRYDEIIGKIASKDFNVDELIEV